MQFLTKEKCLSQWVIFESSFAAVLTHWQEETQCIKDTLYSVFKISSSVDSAVTIGAEIMLFKRYQSNILPCQIAGKFFEMF